MKVFLKKKGASILEYAALFIMIFAGLVAMSQYAQNAMQGQYKKAGESFAFGNTDQGSLYSKLIPKVQDVEENTTLETGVPDTDTDDESVTDTLKDVVGL